MKKLMVTVKFVAEVSWILSSVVVSAFVSLFLVASGPVGWFVLYKRSNR